MPEGPELHLAAQFVRNIGHHHLFTGAVVKSEVSLKNPDVPWHRPRYRVDAISRGKEMKVLLEEVKDSNSEAVSQGKGQKGPLGDLKSIATTSILFRFGMSGKFEWTKVAEMPKHAHLRFISEQDDMMLSFVDYRRFGRWLVEQRSYLKLTLRRCSSFTISGKALFGLIYQNKSGLS